LRATTNYLIILPLGVLEIDKHIEDFSIDEALGYIVFRTANAMRKTFAYLFKKEGIDVTPEELAILISLWKEDGLFQSEINDKTYKDKTTVTRILERIKKKGYIEKRIDEADRRNYKIHLTEKGKALKDKIVPVALKFRDMFLKSIDDRDMDITVNTLKVLLKISNEAGYK